MRHVLILLAAALIAGASLPALALEDGKRAYACNTRGGSEIKGRRFVMEDGRYGPVGQPGSGWYRVQGDKIFFRGGSMDGQQVLRLPDGRLRVTRKIFCLEIDPPVQEAEVAPAPKPKPAPRPEPKLIIVKPGAH